MKTLLLSVAFLFATGTVCLAQTNVSDQNPKTTKTEQKQEVKQQTPAVEKAPATKPAVDKKTPATEPAVTPATDKQGKIEKKTAVEKAPTTKPAVTPATDKQDKIEKKPAVSAEPTGEPRPTPMLKKENPVQKEEKKIDKQ